MDQQQTTEFAQHAPANPAAVPTPPPSPAPSSAPFDPMEALAWCQEHEARVFWFRAADDGQPRCSVEVLAPGSSWNLLRGRGPDFMTAYSAVRGKWSPNESRTAA